MIRKGLFSVFCIGLLSLSSCRDKGQLCPKKEAKKQECVRCTKLKDVAPKQKKLVTRDEAYIKLREQGEKEEKVMTRDEAYLKLRESKS